MMDRDLLAAAAGIVLGLTLAVLLFWGLHVTYGP